MADDPEKQDEPLAGFERTPEVWEVARRGKPPAYSDPDELAEDVIKYLRWVSENPLVKAKAFGTGLVMQEKVKRYPTVAGCAIFIGVAPRTWRDWKKPDHPLQETVLWAEGMMRQIKLEGAAAGIFNSVIVARDLGLKDKSEVDKSVTVNVIDSFEGDNTRADGDDESSE